jgi:hypothetical protein
LFASHLSFQLTSSILNLKSKENIKCYYDSNKQVMVTELRPLNASTDKTGEIVMRGTPDKLLERLVYDDTSTILDPTFIQDFLLTYRVFIEKPQYITGKLHEWFEKLPPATSTGVNSSPQSLSLDLHNLNLKKKIYRIVLEWITNHYNDFETNKELYVFLEKFQEILSREKMLEQFKVLTIAISTKSRPRTITLARSKREEQLQFNIQGGWDKGYGIFISRVDKESKAFELGMRRADQILDVNGHSFQHITLSNAIDILKSFTHTSITLKYNPISFNEMLLHPDKSPYRNKKPLGGGSGGANTSLPNGAANTASTTNANKAVLAEYIQNQYQPPGLITHLNNDTQNLNLLKKTIGSMPPQYPSTVHTQSSTQSLTSLNNITPTKAGSTNPLVAQPKMQTKDNRFKLLSNNANGNSNNSQLKKILGRFNKKAHSKDMESHVDLSAPSLKSITRSPSPSVCATTNATTNSLLNTSTSTLSFQNNSNHAGVSNLTRNNSSHNISMGSSNASFGNHTNHNSSNVSGNETGGGGGQFDTSLTKLNLQDQQQFVGEHVIKIYKNDQTFKYLVVHKVSFL